MAAERIAKPEAPTVANRWAWDRHYTAWVEHLIQAKDGEAPRQPSEVATVAKTATIGDWRRARAAEPVPVWLSQLGETK